METQQINATTLGIETDELEALEGASLVLRTSPADEPVVGPCATRRAG